MSRAGPLAFVAVLALGCAHRPGGAEAALALQLDYVVRYEDPPALAVELSLQGPPRTLLFSRPGGVNEVRFLLADQTERTVAVDGAGEVEPPASAILARYRYELPPLGFDFHTGAGEGDARVVAGRNYLLRPKAVRPGDRATFRVEGADALLPWLPADDGRYLLSGMDLVDSGFHVFNGESCRDEVGGGVVEARRVARLSVPSSVWCDWVKTAAREVLTVRRTLPRKKIAVAVVPVSSREPSPFGMVLWSQPPSVALLAGDRADAAAFARDWVAVHELFHTAHPFVSPPLPWLSEGLATYLTEVGRMRSGRFTREQGFRELLEGFEAGARQAGGDSLEEVTASVGPGRYLAVYWAGALVALETDLAIREASGGTKALGDVLDALGHRTSMSVDDFGAEVDRQAGREIFDALLASHHEGAALARFPAVLASLGVAREGKEIRLFAAPRSKLRDAISAAAGSSTP